MVSHHSNEPMRRGCQHGLGGNYFRHTFEFTVEGAALPHFDDPPVAQQPSEAHLHSAAGHHLVFEGRRDGVVEEPVEVSQRSVDGNVRHRQPRRLDQRERHSS